jgi:hypothetical protein
MLGVSGNVVAFLPNGITYYYFSDNQESTWDAALREADKIAPYCHGSAQEPLCQNASTKCEYEFGRDWFAGEAPPHKICFDEPFWIDRYEVTKP